MLIFILTTRKISRWFQAEEFLGYQVERRKDIRKLVLDMKGGSLHTPVAKLDCELDQGYGIEAL